MWNIADQLPSSVGTRDPRIVVSAGRGAGSSGASQAAAPAPAHPTLAIPTGDRRRPPSSIAPIPGSPGPPGPETDRGTANSALATPAATFVAAERHPPGLVALFATEMWERFSFYTMLAMFTLYLRDATGQGFAWSSDRATGLYANYLMFVYA